MNVLVVGSGGREHAFCWALSKSRRVRRVYCAPGNAGIAGIAQVVDIAATNTDELIAFAKNVGIDLTVCTTEEPLVNGLADAFTAAGLWIFGPNAAAAHIEGSKVYAKDFMKKYKIPTAAYDVFDNVNAAMAYAVKCNFPIVVKADGLAQGKGALICHNLEVAERTLNQILVKKMFGESGNKVVVEEYLEGPECSVLVFCDGENIVPMPSSKDHKAAFDGDMGPNTGGMGAICPNPYYNEEIAAECMQKIYLPTVKGLQKEGREFVGILFFGLMLTKDGPKVIEYNCRPGDPETQAVLPLLETDLLEILLACMDKNLDNLEIKWKNSAVCCVVLASDGYPAKYNTGYSITGLDQSLERGTFIFHSGTKQENEKIVTSGGRVAALSAEAESLDKAREKVYNAIKKIRFKGIRFRSDIGDLGASNPTANKTL